MCVVLVFKKIMQIMTYIRNEEKLPRMIHRDLGRFQVVQKELSSLGSSDGMESWSSGLYVCVNLLG